MEYGSLVASSRVGLATNDSHTERVGDKFSAHMLSNRPADNQPGISVHDGRALHRAVPGGVLGDISDPSPVRLLDAEPALDEVRAGVSSRVAQGAAVASAPVEPLDTRVTHEPGRPA